MKSSYKERIARRLTLVTALIFFLVFLLIYLVASYTVVLSIDHELQLEITVEVRNKQEIEEVLAVGGCQRIMLDNFSPAEIKEAVALIGKKMEIEASGGINEDNLREYAETGVDFISLGALTHSAGSLDLSLKIIS